MPEGADLQKDDFVILHLVTTEVPNSGLEIGDIEVLTPDPDELENGKLIVRFRSLSPVAITWKEKPVDPDAGLPTDTLPMDTLPTDALPQTGDPSSLLGWFALLGASGLGMKAFGRKKE